MCVPQSPERQQQQRPDPKMLGDGLAGQAGLAIKNRKRQLDEELRRQGG